MAKKKPIDRATQYARDVCASKIVAGPHVRDACRRHLDDLDRGPLRGLVWDVESAQEAIAFFEEILCLNGGDFEGKKFLLLPWQCFIVGALFGWKNAATGYRRFRVAYIETAKGSGKSPLCAGIGMKGLVADGEARAEIYAAATHKDQAKVLFGDALAMYDQSPELQNRLMASGTGQNRWNLAYPRTGSFMRVISSENKGKSGPRPHMGLLDEIHEHPNGDVIEMIRAGFKFRKQPLNVMITNSGHDKTSVCWEYHEMGLKVAAQTLENDEIFAFICALDEEDLKDDRFLTDESCWEKVNPSLSAGIPGYGYIRSQVKEAQGMPSKEAVVKRLNFCVWTEALNPWISYDVWKQCEGDSVDEALLLGRRCWGGLDLSSTTDLTARALIFEPIEDDPVWRLVVKFWLPGAGLKQKADKDRVPYLSWRDAGHLITLDGRAINKLAILREISADCERYDLQCVAYDRWRIEDLIMLANQEGIEMSIYDPEHPGYGIQMVPFGQGFKEMSPALDKFETMLLNAELAHDGNPVLTWCAANAVTSQDPAGNKKVAKDKATGRVDGIVAAIMAAGVSNTQAETASVYETRGVITL